MIGGISAGFYLPSGIAALTGLIRREDWGKAMAIHELAPNTGTPEEFSGFIRHADWVSSWRRGYSVRHWVSGGGPLVLGGFFSFWGADLVRAASHHGAGES